MNLDTIRYLLAFLRDLAGYLPVDRYAHFLGTWVVNHQIRGRVHRAVVRRRLGYDPPANINISPTSRCNLRCRGCYASAYPRRQDMTSAQLEEVIEQARGMGVTMIGLLGGEPLLRGHELLDVLARHRDVGFRITTNGTLLDDDLADRLADNPHVAVFISVEGLGEHTDAWRGEGVFASIEAAMDRLRQRRVLFGFSALVHAANQHIVASEEFFAAMRERGARLAAFFNYGPVGSRPMYDLVLSEQASRRSKAHIEELALRHGLLVKIEGYRSPEGSPLAFLNGAGCEAGRGVHITPRGQVEPCNGIQFHTASVFERPLAEILGSPLYRQLHDAARARRGGCVAIYAPEQLLDVVDRCGATGSNERSFSCLHDYVRACSSGGAACGGACAPEAAR